MQQRYYDPQIGRFLSRDPVTANPNTGANFNAYWYANNNPFLFTDPDGRLGDLCKSGGGMGCEGNVAGNSGDSESTEVVGRRWDGQIPSTPLGNLKGTVGDAMKSQLDSVFEKKLFDRYWYGDGDYKLTEAEFTQLATAAGNLTAIDTMQFSVGGANYTAQKFKFYGAGFSGSIGSGWMISNSAGAWVGFFDRYDFNSKPWFRGRDIDDELKTRLVGPAGSFFRAQPYSIFYGVYTELP